MQKRVFLMLMSGFVMGLSLASCATTDSSEEVSRDPASARVYRADGRDCYTGEFRDSEGYCVRAQEVARPARRGGR